jgi:HSP20 family protein
MFGGRRRPSIFDMFGDFFGRGFPLSGREGEGDWFNASFEDMIRRLEQSMPEEMRNYMTEEQTPEGKIRRYGPFVYGFSYSAEPGKDPQFQEFGNVRPTPRGMQPAPEGREPLVDVMEEGDKYRIFVELPGVEKENLKLDVADNSVQVRTADEKKFYKMIELEQAINPDTAKASYKNGVLTIDIDKAAKRTGKEVNIE